MEEERDKEEKDKTEMLFEPEFSQSSNILFTKKQLIVVKNKRAVLQVWGSQVWCRASAFGFLS